MNLNAAFWIGNVIRYFKLARIVKPTVKDLFADFVWLDYIFSDVNLDPDLYREVSEWVKKLEEEYEENQRISEDDALKLFQDATKWEDLIDRLLLERQVFELIRSGALNQKALIAASKDDSQSVKTPTFHPKF